MDQIVKQDLSQEVSKWTH